MQGWELGSRLHISLHQKPQVLSAPYGLPEQSGDLPSEKLSSQICIHTANANVLLTYPFLPHQLFTTFISILAYIWICQEKSSKICSKIRYWISQRTKANHTVTTVYKNKQAIMLWLQKTKLTKHVLGKLTPLKKKKREEKMIFLVSIPWDKFKPKKWHDLV